METSGKVILMRRRLEPNWVELATCAMQDQRRRERYGKAVDVFVGS